MKVSIFKTQFKKKLHKTVLQKPFTGTGMIADRHATEVHIRTEGGSKYRNSEP